MKQFLLTYNVFTPNNLIFQLSELQKFLAKEEESTKTEGSENTVVTKVVNPRIIASCLQSICAVENVDAKDAEKIAMTTLIPAHHPYIGKLSGVFTPVLSQG